MTSIEKEADKSEKTEEEEKKDDQVKEGIY